MGGGGDNACVAGFFRIEKHTNPSPNYVGFVASGHFAKGSQFCLEGIRASAPERFVFIRVTHELQ